MSNSWGTLLLRQRAPIQYITFHPRTLMVAFNSDHRPDEPKLSDFQRAEIYTMAEDVIATLTRTATNLQSLMDEAKEDESIQNTALCLAALATAIGGPLDEALDGIARMMEGDSIAVIALPKDPG